MSTSTLSAFHCSFHSFPLMTPFYSSPMERCFCFASTFSFHLASPSSYQLYRWLTVFWITCSSILPHLCPSSFVLLLRFFASCHGSPRKPEPQYPDWALLVWHSWLQSPLSQSPVTHRSSWLQPSPLARSHKSFTSHSDRVMGSLLLPADTHAHAHRRRHTTHTVFNLCGDFQTLWSAFFFITSLFSCLPFSPTPVSAILSPISLPPPLSFPPLFLSASSHVPFGLQLK